jgi:hypothetical protein
MSRRLLIVPLLLASGLALAEDVPAAKPAPPPEEEAKPAAPEGEKKDDAKEDAKSLGMSVLGNQEAPKALVIVPWKGSVIGNSVDISTLLDDSRLPIDKEVFMRALSYYEVRSTTTRHDGAAAGPSDAAQPPAAAHRR